MSFPTSWPVETNKDVVRAKTKSERELKQTAASKTCVRSTKLSSLTLPGPQPPMGERESET